MEWRQSKWRLTRVKNHPRMRFKRQDTPWYPSFMRKSASSVDHLTMAKMNAVKVANGDGSIAVIF
jgi:hypothetical protein